MAVSLAVQSQKSWIHFCLLGIGNLRRSPSENLVFNQGSNGEMNKSIFLETTKIWHIISE